MIMTLMAVALPTWPAYASDWPPVTLPDGTDTADVSARMIYNGTEMRSMIFTSPRSVDDVVGFYKTLWAGQVVVNDIAGWRVVGHKQDGYFITVQVRADGRGSRGDIGTTRVPRERRKIELGKGVPMPGNSVVVNDIYYPDDATPARTLAMTSPLSIQQNAAFYRQHLQAAGWKNAQGEGCQPSAAACVMNYDNGDRKITVALSANGGKSDIVINMLGPGAEP